VTGQPYHARILYRLKKALPTIPNSEQMTQDDIQSQLTNYKVQLCQQLGCPNQQQTWLEELAKAQAKARGTTTKND